MCSVGIILTILSGCASQPEIVNETAPEPVVFQEDVWTLLARGESDRARPFFMGLTDVNDTDAQGRTPLHFAAIHQDHVLATFFIAMGAQVDARDNEQRTALTISAGHLDAATARVLVNAGADIHQAMTGPSTPARVGIQEAGPFLSSLLTPAALSSVDYSGRTILHIAADLGNAAAVNSILRAGNTISQRDRDGKTALDIALERTDSRNHAEVAESLILAGASSDRRLFTHFAPAVRSANYNIRSADGMAPLHFIAREGYMGFLLFVLEKNVDINIKNAAGATPLHEAARSGNIQVIEALLNHGADVNVQDANGNSVLHIAAPHDSALRVTQLFLSRGVNPNIRDEHGDSPLHVAITLNRHPELIRALLGAGADVTIRNMDGKTPLYVAVEKERAQYLPLLLRYRSDIFAVDNNGSTPFERAIRQQSALVFSMITNESVFQNDSEGNTILHLTVRSGGNIAIINSILDRNASVNARNKAGDTSLTIAVRNNEEAAGLLLLNRGADIFAANANGESPLSLTFPPEGGSYTELRRWMLNNQTLSARDGLGNTALHYAAQWRLDAWIPLLIQMGARTEAANATGETPLFFAVRQDSPSTIRLLVTTGANIGARDTLGNSALHAAVRWNALNGANTLLDMGLYINSHALNGKTPLHDSIRWWMLDMKMLLLDRGADIEIRDAEGNTAFMEAVIAGNPMTMELLARMGADTNTRNFRGDTALHISAATDRIDISTLLLTWGVSIHARNAQDRTPFQNALHQSPRLVRVFLTGNRLNSADDFGSSPLHIAVQERAPITLIHTILELGARQTTVDFEGRTPLRLAVDLDQLDTARLLADSGADIFFAARDGRNAAEVALTKGEPMVRALFSGDAISSRDSSGNTILHYAARQGNSEMISLLLSMGAERNVRNIAAESPAEIALRWRHPEAARLLN